MKRLLLFALPMFVLTSICHTQNATFPSSQTNNLITTFTQLTQEQLYDTANYYLKQNSFDTALVCFNIIISTPAKNNTLEQQMRIINAHNRMGVIYTYMCDYRSAYKYLIDALLLCEKNNIQSLQIMTYNNLGNIYAHFKKFDIAKSYYYMALNLCQDSKVIASLLNNLSFIEQSSGRIDSAFYYLNEAMQINKGTTYEHFGSNLNNMASLFQKTKQYDSAFYYFQLSLDEAKNNNQAELEAQTLYDLSNLFIEINKTDSALFYIGLSNTIAEKNNFLGIMTENYLALSKIEESKGKIKSALIHFKKYAGLKDSVLNSEIFGDINQLQRLFEVGKTNQQIEQLIIEQQIKERTIYYQKIIWFITLGVLLLVSIGLLFIYLQKKELNRAYKVLVEKNLEIVDFQKQSPEVYQNKNKKSALAMNKQSELLDRILVLMEEVTTICDTEFSIEKLAELVHSNQNYVSQVINSTLKMNFRSLLNSYRIQEAQKIFSTPDTVRYTIEYVALQVGFKSRAAFINAFKEITGVTPNFYLKSMQEEKI